MTQTVTLNLTEDVARSARQIAAQTHRRLEDVLTEWIARGVQESDFELLPDDDILVLADAQLLNEDQDTLNRLLEKQREGELSDEERPLLNSLMAAYRSGLVRKAKALRVAVQRGMRPPIG